MLQAGTGAPPPAGDDPTPPGDDPAAPPPERAFLAAAGPHLAGLRLPGPSSRVRKAECGLSFASPRSPGGLLVDLRSWQAYGPAAAAARGKRGLFLRVVERKVPEPEAPGGAGAAPAVGAAAGGGLAVDLAGPENRFTLEHDHSVVCLPEGLELPLAHPELPEFVRAVADAVIKHDDASLQDQVQSWQEEIRPSKHAAALVQLAPAGPISSNPADWACGRCGSKANLWMNLSDGYIGCGRQHFDGTGGCGASLVHFDETGRKFPLAVKLGTITPKGADVFSYAPDENDMVLDERLAAHLAHWGINMMQMEKTEKTMTELQIDLNLKHEFDAITEDGASLTPLSGPGYVGLQNLGNSCYLNATLQALCVVPAFTRQYADRHGELIGSAPEEAADDLVTQTAKLAGALVHLAGVPEGEPAVVAPRMFKTVLGRGHGEFSTGRQQDAAEFFQYVLEQLERRERADAARLRPDCPLARAFTFEFEDRVQCAQSRRVAYKRRADNMLALRLPVDPADAQRASAEREIKRKRLGEQRADVYIDAAGVATDASGQSTADAARAPSCTLQECLEKLAGGERIADFLSSATGERGDAVKTTAVRTFPPFLMVCLQRYYVDENWVPKKLEAEVDVPETLDLEWLRAKGPQPDEQLLPEDAGERGDTAAAAAVRPDPQIVAQLVAMGFSENGCKRAAVATRNASAEASMEWVFAHMEDPDFNAPLPAEGGGGPPAPAPDAAAVDMLTGMGFSAEHATIALGACGGSLERAADWLFSHPDPEAAVKAEAGAAAAGGGKEVDDGPGTYELVGFISHIGSNTASGHYVAHIKKAGQWVIHNDEKVAVSARAPTKLGYMYLFRRTAGPGGAPAAGSG